MAVLIKPPVVREKKVFCLILGDRIRLELRFSKAITVENVEGPQDPGWPQCDLQTSQKCFFGGFHKRFSPFLTASLI